MTASTRSARLTSSRSSTIDGIVDGAAGVFVDDGEDILQRLTGRFRLRPSRQALGDRIDVTRPAASVAITPSPILESVTLSCSARLTATRRSDPTLLVTR